MYAGHGSLTGILPCGVRARDRLLAACRAGDTLVVTRLDRLAWSLPDARSIADERFVLGA